MIKGPSAKNARTYLSGASPERGQQGQYPRVHRRQTGTGCIRSKRISGGVGVYIYMYFELLVRSLHVRNKRVKCGNQAWF